MNYLTYSTDGMRKQGETTKQPIGRKERKEKAEVLNEQKKATRKVTRKTNGAKKGKTTSAKKTH